MLNLLALSCCPVAAQEEATEEDVSPSFYGEVAKQDGTLILTYVAETREALTYIPEQLGGEDKPIAYKSFYVWIFSSAHGPSAIFTFNYSIYEQEVVTEYFVDPETEETYSRNVTRWSKLVANDTFRILTGEKADFRGQITFELHDFQSNITRCFEIQYLDAKIRFFYYTHPGLKEYTMPGWAVNMLGIAYVIITFILCNLVATGGAKRFLSRVIYAAPPPSWLTWVSAIGVAVGLSLVTSLAQYPSVSLLWLNIQTIPAALVLLPLFMYSIWNTATTFNSEAIERYIYLIYSQAGPDNYPEIDIQNLLVYAREVHGEKYHCWLPEPNGGGILGMVKRLFGYDILIRGNPTAGYTYKNRLQPQGKTHIIPVEKDQFSFDLGSYMLEQQHAQGLRLLVYTGAGLGILGIVLFLLQPTFSMLLIISAILVFGLVGAQYIRIVRGETKSAEIRIEPTEHDAARIWFHSEVVKELNAKMKEIYGDYAALQAKMGTETFERGQEFVRGFANIYFSSLGINPQSIKPEIMAETLIATGIDVKRIRAPEKYKDKVKKSMKEFEEQEPDPEPKEPEAEGGT